MSIAAAFESVNIKQKLVNKNDLTQAYLTFVGKGKVSPLGFVSANISDSAHSLADTAITANARARKAK